MKITNIDWDIDVNESTDYLLENYSDKEICKLLGYKTSEFKDIGNDIKYAMICNKLHHMPGIMEDIYNLPSEVEIEDNLFEDDQDITDYLTEEYGFCINSWNYDFETERI